MENRASGSTCICKSILELPGYLIFNDEDDGYRLTWVRDSSWQLEGNCIEPLPNVTATRNCCRIPGLITHEKSWEYSVNDRMSGKMATGLDLEKDGDLTIAFEAYLRIELLLSCIVSSRKILSEAFMPNNEQLFPDYFYNLLSVTGNGRTADLVIAFRHRQKPGCVAVFVSLDLFMQTYKALNWVRNSSVTDSLSLRTVCNSLALNHRMRERRLGPYSVDSQDHGCWGGFCKQTNCEFDFDLERDSDPALWGPFIEHVREDRKKGVSRKETQELIPKAVSFSSLYSDCEMITNRAVTCAKPVSSLTGKVSPVEIVYG